LSSHGYCLQIQEKIRKKIEELEKASGKVLNSVAVNIIEQYAPAMSEVRLRS